MYRFKESLLIINFCHIHLMFTNHHNQQTVITYSHTYRLDYSTFYDNKNMFYYQGTYNCILIEIVKVYFQNK